MDQELILLDTVSSMIEGEILRGLLQSQGVQAMLSQESAGGAIGLTTGALGAVELWIRSDQEQLARAVLADYRSGQLPPEV